MIMLVRMATPGMVRRIRSMSFRKMSPAAEFATVLRNHAEGARVVATLGNFHVREVPGSSQHARREVVIEVGLDGTGSGFDAFAERHDLLDLVGADDGVDLRHLAPDLV